VLQRQSHSYHGAISAYSPSVIAAVPSQARTTVAFCRTAATTSPLFRNTSSCASNAPYQPQSSPIRDMRCLHAMSKAVNK